MPDRHRRILEYVLVVAASMATATVLLVVDGADRAGRQAGAPPAATVTTVTTAPSTEPAPTPAPTAAPAPTGTPAPPVTTRTPTSTRPPPPAVPPSLAGKDVERIPTSRRVVALTFDAGANPDGVSAILATLRREGVPATFFLTGEFASRFPGPSAAIAAAGHRLGNHSVGHPYFTQLSDQAIRGELGAAEQAIRRATGAGAQPLFRFPYGDRDQRTIAVVNGAGYVPVRWTVDSLGWKGTSGAMTADAVTSRVLAGLRPGQIVLMHVGSNPDDRTTLDADALPSVIERIRAAGYGFVTLDALLDQGA